MIIYILKYTKKYIFYIDYKENVFSLKKLKIQTTSCLIAHLYLSETLIYDLNSLNFISLDQIF